MFRRLTAILALVAITNPLCCCNLLAEAVVDGHEPAAEHSCCHSPEPTNPTGERETPGTPRDCACCAGEIVAVAAEFPTAAGAADWQWRSDDHFAERVLDLLSPQAGQPSDFAIPAAARPPAPRMTQLLCVYLI